uniref:Uncharacterized protein n=1 Tax=Molossus molossus TaxID=27622 RepID=A0A7J8BYD6_MOLMO|nr:hypothetical protein HJG59_010028 [Molossus molossus]
MEASSLMLCWSSLKYSDIQNSPSLESSPEILPYTFKQLWFTTLSRESVPQPDITSISIKHSGKGDTMYLHKASLNLPALIIPSTVALRGRPVCSLCLLGAHATALPVDFRTSLWGSHVKESRNFFSTS